MIDTLLSLAPREVPRAFVHVARNLSPAATTRVAQALARKLSLAHRAEAGDEAFALLLAHDAEGRSLTSLYTLHAAFREAVIADAAWSLGLVPCDPRFDPIPADLRRAAPHAVELLVKSGARGLAPIRMSASIACSVEPLAMGDDPFTTDLEDAEMQAGDFSCVLLGRAPHDFSACPAPDGWSEQSLRIPGATRLLIVAPDELFRAASRRRGGQKESAA
ncbi:hypothetical protein [Falsiroseomonas oryzae]|uniref:hypothetical protein n=1 Tax=Falsiroseomonas oryzae TaxID=2766473 RepID=UPI0022EA693E|nr:hypothetical protein [Roseomonas sp. MO-31]